MRADNSPASSAANAPIVVTPQRRAMSKARSCRCRAASCPARVAGRSSVVPVASATSCCRCTSGRLTNTAAGSDGATVSSAYASVSSIDAVMVGAIATRTAGPYTAAARASSAPIAAGSPSSRSSPDTSQTTQPGP